MFLKSGLNCLYTDDAFKASDSKNPSTKDTARDLDSDAKLSANLLFPPLVSLVTCNAVEVLFKFDAKILSFTSVIKRVL